MPNARSDDSVSQLIACLVQGKMSRRNFLEGATALGLSITAATSLLSEARAATPKKGGLLRAGLDGGATTDTLDPATFPDTFIIAFNFGGLRNCLTEVDNEGKLVGELAESWSASDDAKQWIFKLRKGVEFHNGKTMDADDVVASINHHRGEDSASAAKSILDAVEDIKADGKDTVVVTLSGGNADLPFLMSDYHLLIMPAKEGKVDWQSGVGTGGYSLTSFEPGVRATAKRNPNYWKPGRANFDEIEIIGIQDPAARTNALMTNEIDVMSSVDLKTVDRLKQKAGIRVEQTTGTSHKTFAMFTDVAPFDDNNVRMALKLAIDREELVQKVWRGYAVLGNDQPIAPANRFHAGAIPQRTYDPDKAKWHLKQAGLSSLKIDLSASDGAYPGAVDAAVLYKEHAARAGIEINLIREPADGYWTNVWLKKPFVSVSWSGRATEDWMFSTAYAAGVEWNDSHWSHERFNKLLVEARAELDEAKRAEMYGEMQLLVRDEGGVVIPVFTSYVFAMADKVQQGPMWGNWDVDGLRLLERWWMA
jgi:peptide/nickel transport system substrate-binding protein